MNELDALIGSALGPGYYLGASNARVLRKGMRGEDVRSLQQALIVAGFPVAGGADGAFGDGTYRAVVAFQKARGLSPDGVAGPATLAALNSDYGTLSPASSPGEVPSASPSAPKDESSSVLSILTRKYGPLPVYGWGCLAIALGLGGYLAWSYSKKQSNVL